MKCGDISQRESEVMISRFFKIKVCEHFMKFIQL